jgi:valyl-tRNA synthetase
MDTWMTSSLTPLINANWAGSEDRKGSMALHPMSVRVQAFEIIRTWLFYTLFKSHEHLDSLPWHDVMISGWGLNEQGKKISKRDLSKFTDKDGYNRYDPTSVIEKFGADALRYWAAGSHLGHDLRFHERDVKAGRKLVLKLWNAARFTLMQMEGFDPAAPRPEFGERTPEDRWLLIELNKCIDEVTKGFEIYEFAVSREALDRFFWHVFCDNYLELIKDRFWRPDQYPDSARASGQATLYESLRTLLGLFAPFLPFVTETLYQKIYRADEQLDSLHISPWPRLREDADLKTEVPEMRIILAVLKTVRLIRSAQNVGATRKLKALTLDTREADEATQAMVQRVSNSLQAVARCETIQYDAATEVCSVPGIRVSVEVD